MIKIWHIVAFVAALAIFAVARAPVSLVAPSRADGFSYSRADGTIWGARFADASWAGLPAGEAKWQLKATDLLQGIFTGTLETSGPGVTGAVTIRRSLGGSRTIGAYEMALDGVPVGEDLVLDGRTVLRELDLRFRGDECTVATGRAESDVLTQNATLLNWTGPMLAGTWQCAGDTAELALRGLDDSGAVTLFINVRADGTGFWRAEALPSAPGASAALAAAGFERSPGGALAQNGEFQWLSF